ncbi:MAG: hypothetical protein WCO89_02150 [Syntrophus sp. (in: bacteria)]
MPLLHLFGRVYEIPFDPDKIAEFMNKGFTVRPNPDTHPEQAELEGWLIHKRRQSLWDAENFKTVPGQMDIVAPVNPPPVVEAPAHAGNGESFRDPRFQGNVHLNSMNVIPTPKIHYNLREIVPKTFRPKTVTDDLLDV